VRLLEAKFDEITDKPTSKPRKRPQKGKDFEISPLAWGEPGCKTEFFNTIADHLPAKAFQATGRYED